MRVAAPPTDERILPEILDVPTGPEPAAPPPAFTLPPEIALEPPLGFTGRSGVVPSLKANRDFIPVEDRWRAGFPAWDRYGRGQPHGDDYPYELGHWWDPYNQNVLKGDYPIVGQHFFLNVTATLQTLFEPRQVPTGTTPFESTARSFQEEFFGRPNQALFAQNLKVSFDLFHGDAAFKPMDLRVKLTPVFNVNAIDVQELAVVNPDVTRGTVRWRTFTALEEYFAEAKLADHGPEYDFVSLRVGSQPFVSDFRGHIFADTNRAVRLFGTAHGNRDQYNLAYFRQAEKDTNSLLNTFHDRPQNIIIGNYYRQDVIWPGYTVNGSVHYNNDRRDFLFDRNNFLVRPDPVGTFQPHQVDAVYLGFAGEGHVERYNVSHAFYWALGRDSQNPLANDAQRINAQFAACEVSYDRDYVRFRVSGLWASGDGNVNNGHATGFATILDNPNFAGSEFSYFARQAIGLFGVNLTQRQSLLPDLRSSKFQGQSNFVNPGLALVNGGFDVELTPKLRMINNASFLWFDKTASLETFLFDGNIDREIGTDLSSGFEYRPLLSNNIIITTGLAALVPGRGFKQIYNRFDADVNPLLAGFLEVTLTY